MTLSPSSRGAYFGLTTLRACYCGRFKGVSKSVQVLFDGMVAVRELPLRYHMPAFICYILYTIYYMLSILYHRY